MKGKFRILGHIGLGVFMVCALMVAFLPAAPVAANGTEVTNVYVEFPFTDSINETSDSNSSNIYIVHFKPTTALKRGVDYVTVTFPDGSETMCGTADITRAFTLATASATKLVKADVKFSTNYHTTDLINGADWYQITLNPTIGGKRAKCVVPIDIAAGTDVWVKFEDSDTNGAITTSTGEADTYKVYVSTTKDTTPVLSSTFSLGATSKIVGSTTVESSYPVPTTAGATGEYIVYFTPANAVTGASGKVTLKFPVGTVLPSSISATEVLFKVTSGGSYSPCSETPVVDTDRRLITAIPSVTLTKDVVDYIKVLSSAGITNPTTADPVADAHYKVAVRTSADRQWAVSSAGYLISAGSGNKVVVGNGDIGEATAITNDVYYSDDATMINMWSSQIYVVLADKNGNGLTPSSATTLNLSSSSTTGSFAYNEAADTSGTWHTGVTSTIIDATNGYDPYSNPSTQMFYYKDSTAGTHTLTFKASGYADATWDITVCPGVSLYDASDNLINTYAAPTNTPVAEIDASSTYTQKYSYEYVNDAITAAITGDTVKLGDGIYEVEDSVHHGIQVTKAITFTSVNGASSTTLRNVEDAEYLVSVPSTADGTATNPIIIDGFTFERLRPGIDIFRAIVNNSGNYVTVRNCIFNYIMPDDDVDSHIPYPGGVVVFTIIHEAGADDLTSLTVSNNTFNNCCTFSTTGKPANILFAIINSNSTMKGVTISGNTITDCNGFGICVFAGTATSSIDAANITDNTVTNGLVGIEVQGWTGSTTAETGVNVLRNTVTGAYMYGVMALYYVHDYLVIKNNTVTGCAGCDATSADIHLRYDGTTTANVVQYNAIYDNDAEYSIYVQSDIGQTQDCKYNYFGDATGPYYSAVSGATIKKSNPNGTGDKITDLATYYPWLHKPVTDVVADNVSWQTSVMKLVLGGWNTLSTPVPLIESADTIDELISEDDMEIGYYYDGSWTQITTGYVLEPCDAVYVKMKSTASTAYVQLKFECETFSTPSKDLAVGWNLISLAYLNSAGLGADLAVASVALDSAGLPGYSQVISPSLNATRYDLYYNTDTAGWSHSSGQTGSGGTMYAGMGYWIYMQNTATLAGFEITPIAPDLD